MGDYPIDVDLLREALMEKLPKKVQAILAADESQRPLRQIVLLADRIMEKLGDVVASHKLNII